VRPRSGAPAGTACVQEGDERKAAEKARKAQVRSGKLVQGHGDSGLDVDYFVHDHAVRDGCNKKQFLPKCNWSFKYLTDSLSDGS